MRHWFSLAFTLLACLSPQASRADVVFAESFEGATNSFSGSSTGYVFAYTANYTNAKPTGAGLQYFYGGSGLGAGTTQFTTSNFAITTANLTAAKIDAGLGQFNFSAWFSTFGITNPPPEYAYLRLQFKDGSGGNLGSYYEIGGQAFTGTIPTSGGKRDWGQDVKINAIPVLARQAALTIYSYGSSGDRDGYADLVSLDVTAVPEPGTLLLGAIAAASGGTGLWWKRRKKPDQSDSPTT